jgi:hypothetical protein
MLSCSSCLLHDFYRVANSGSFYAVNNLKTQNFFLFMVYSVNTIVSSRSHQSTMHYTLSEHASLFGLRSKTLKEDHLQLPSMYQVKTFVLPHQGIFKKRSTHSHALINAHSIRPRSFLYCSWMAL